MLAVPPPQEILEHGSTLLAEERSKPLDALVEHLVGDGERDARVPGAAGAEAFAGSERDACLLEDPLDGDSSAGSRSQAKNVPSERAPGSAATTRSRRSS